MRFSKSFRAIDVPLAKREIGVQEMNFTEVSRIGDLNNSFPRLLRLKCSDFETKCPLLAAAKESPIFSKLQECVH